MFLEKPLQQISLPTPSTSDDKPRDAAPYTTADMAAGVSMPVQQFTASPTQYTLFNSQQTSPINSATATPNNPSPTSPRVGIPAYLQQQSKQLRPPKSPLYVPAVLRATEPSRRAARPSPLTPPPSKDNSFDELGKPGTLSRRMTGDSIKSGLGEVVEAEWIGEGLGKVTALPTRAHWKVCQPTFLSS